jgi:tungstate transport system substrate-binding protein
MGATLRLAGEGGAYTLADRATFLTHRDQAGLALLHSGSRDLDNPYSILAVSPQKHPATRVRAASEFADFLTGPVGQGLIARFGADRYGEPLFHPLGR